MVLCLSGKAKMKKKRQILAWLLPIILIIAAIGYKGIQLFFSRKAVNVNYISGELIFSPGAFYAIDSYQEDPIYIYDTVLQFASAREGDYVFHITEHSGMQYLTIHYHDFTGKANKVKYQVEFDDSNYFVVVTEVDTGTDSYIFSA